MNDDLLTKTFLLFSGICWMIVYIEGLRIGLRDRSYAIIHATLHRRIELI
ncbi:hypothetical protein [Thiospirillum jenense]|uniref:Uncharacterized protein n=1 Tax=Thiospirillum jenense TaxID=1653858 RepID=A0A839H5A3_9GAMM|nr:hypothetical protein [Thiospirillum jenense]MBB1125165.1 hypothetical protein [Thiospirillum jenense]